MGPATRKDPSKPKATETEERRKELELLTNNDLWTADLKPREKKQTKATRQQKARRKLMKMGIITNDLENKSNSNSNGKSNGKSKGNSNGKKSNKGSSRNNNQSQNVSSNKSQTRSTTKSNNKSQKKKKPKQGKKGQYIMGDTKRAPPKTHPHSYRPPTPKKKEIKIPTSRRPAVRTYDAKATHWTKMHSRGSGLVSVIKCGQSSIQKGSKTRSAKVKDPWADEDQLSHHQQQMRVAQKKENKRKEALRKAGKEDTFSGGGHMLKGGGADFDAKAAVALSLRAVPNAGPVIQTGKKFKFSRPAPNPCRRYVDAITLPNPADSINPLRHDYYYKRWKAIRHTAFKKFREQYGNPKVAKFWEDFELDNSDTLSDELKAIREGMLRITTMGIMGE